MGRCTNSFAEGAFGEPYCVWCDCEVVYRITRNVKNRKTGAATERRLFKCAMCLKQFSVTSGTIVHGRKLSFKKIMLGALLFADGAAGKPALHLRRDLRCNHKAAWTFEHKLREAMTNYVTSRELTGEIEMDATSIGGSIRLCRSSVSAVAAVGSFRSSVMNPNWSRRSAD